MKLRTRPEDFVVIELDRFDLDPRGEHALYRLTKWNSGTLEAVAALSRALGAACRAVGFGGLKDRHAWTEQVVSVRGGQERDVHGRGFRAEFLGRSREPITKRSFEANRFHIVVRDLERAPDPGPILTDGVPNYFDDQRMGSLRGGGGEFIARALVRGDHEQALRLALASPAPADRRSDRALEARMARHWGDWRRLARELPPSPQRRAAEVLARRPGAFGFAFESLPRDLRILWLSAWQSHLWNKTLAALVARLADIFEVRFATGPLPFYRRLEGAAGTQLRALSIPYVTATQTFDEPVATAVAGVLAAEGVSARQFRLRRMRNCFFSRGSRPAVVVPAGLTLREGPDERHPGRRRVTLDFELPRGAYATVVVKALFGDPAAPLSPSSRPDRTPLRRIPFSV